MIPFKKLANLVDFDGNKFFFGLFLLKSSKNQVGLFLIDFHMHKTRKFDPN